MTDKEFLNAVANGRIDLVQVLLEILADTRSAYCVVGGLAVNAYAEPVVSLDLDVVVAAENVQKVSQAAAARGLKVQEFEHSVNLSSPLSDLRIQLQTDERYQGFIARAQQKQVLGYSMKVAAVEDVLQGKTWAYQDQTRRRSKRQKDLADIMRLVEVQPELQELLPDALREQIKPLGS